jgi:hypothetical protein
LIKNRKEWLLLPSPEERPVLIKQYHKLEAKELLAKDGRRNRSSCFTRYVLWRKESSPSEDNAEVSNSSLETFLTSVDGSG